MSALGIVYPGAHIVSSMIAAATGIDIGRAMMFVIAGMTTMFLVFVPMVLRTLAGDRVALAAGTFSACFLLPITNVSTFIDFHSFTLATLFFPLVLFLLFKYLADARSHSGLDNLFSASSLLLVTAGIATDLYHPQVAVNMLVLFATVVAVQWLYRWLPGGGPLSDARSLLAPTLLIAGFFVVWTLRYEVVYSMLGGLIESLSLFLDGQAHAGQIVQQREASADGLGVGLFELFWKLFFVHATYVLLAAGLVLAWLAGQLGDDNPQRDAAVTYVTYGGLALTPFFLLHFVGDVSGYFFRHVGFGMMLITILGALGLHSLHRRAAASDVAAWLRPIAVVAVVAALTLSVLVMLPSPYMYKATPHVTEQTMSGHEMAFEHQDSADDVRFVGLSPGPERYSDALRIEVMSFDGAPPAYLEANNLTEYRGEFRGKTPYYFGVSNYNYGVEVRAHNGHEYGRAAFANLGTEPGVSRVQTNGDFTLYHVTGPEEFAGVDPVGPSNRTGNGTGGESTSLDRPAPASGVGTLASLGRALPSTPGSV
jgi:hypothetical protein